MNDPRAEHAARESRAWNEFERALERVPNERWEEAGILEGWTVKEMLWHVTWWLEEGARNLERPARDATDPVLPVDERNAQLAAEARGMSIDAVHDGMLAAREHVLERWRALETIDPRAVEDFAEETYEHYDEHRLDLERIRG